MRIFIVEDDPYYANILEYTLGQNPENEIHKFHSGSDLLDNLYQLPDVVTIDYSLPDTNGGVLMQKVLARVPTAKVIIISSQQNVSTAIGLLKKGAYDYIVKDDDVKERLWGTVRNLKGHVELQNEVESLREKVGEQFDFSQTIIGESAAIKKSFKLIAKAAATGINVTITGETGTGKEVVANAIHYNSDRKRKKIVAVNMAAIPRDLVESELFGHEKGAFTGASSMRIGKFEEANGGTIFLDEIGELDLNVQAKLLRVIQEGEVVRVGGNKPIKFNARIISATHKNLSDEVKKGRFRQDLYYRLLGLPLELPALRERGGDILILTKFFLKNFAKDNGLTTKNLHEETRKKLMKYPFPGNVRELKSVVELAAVMSDGVEIMPEDITFNSLDNTANFLLEEDTLKGYTQRIIDHYLEKYDQNVLLVAKKLDMGKSTIYQMLKNGEVGSEKKKVFQNME